MFFREIDFRSKMFVIVRLCSVLNLIQIRIYDAFHSKWKNLKRILHSFLITSMLSKKNNTQYFKTFQKFSYFSNWSRIQNFIFYIDSWFLSKTDKIFIFFSLILRFHVTMKWFRLSYLQNVKRMLNVKTFSLRTIVKIFDVIVEFNILIDSQKHIYFEKLHDVIVKIRQAYQNFIRCDMNFAQIFQFDSKFVENFFHNFDVETNFLNENNVMIEMLFVVAKSVEFEFEFSFLISRAQSAKRTEKKKRKRKFKENKFENLFRLFNVHVDFHFVDNAKEYVTIMNVNVLIEKMKHMLIYLFTLIQMLKLNSKFSKQWQTTSFFSNFMKYMFVKNVMIQSMKFELIETWNYSEFDLMKTLNYVDNKCSSLVQNFLSIHERSQEKNNENRIYHVRDDSTHYNVQLFLFDFVLNKQLRIKSKTNLMKLNFQHFFLQSLMTTYRRNYNFRVMNFENKTLKWYQKIAYTDR